MTVRVQKWGNSLALRIPSAVANELDVKTGTPVEIKARNGSIVITPTKRPKYSLRKMLKEIPIRLIKRPENALYGAAHYASRLKA